FITCRNWRQTLSRSQQNQSLAVASAELSLNLGDGKGQAAASRRRQFFSAASASLKIMASAVLFERHPLERTVRWRTVANELSMGLLVRRCFQCAAGKSNASR